jgi:hypothetical protein
MKTPWYILVSLTTVLALVLAACGAAATGSTPAGNTNTSAGSQSLSDAAELAAGTLKLDGTDQDITADQASELLTLWQAYQSLSATDTTAQVELDALVEQIRETMTAGQIQAIDDMQITSQTMAEVMAGAAGAPVLSGDASDASAPGQMPSGGGPGGAPMDGGGPGGDTGVIMGDGNMGTGTQATPAANSQGNTQSSGVNPMLLNAVIQMLEAKAR